VGAVVLFISALIVAARLGRQSMSISAPEAATAAPLQTGPFDDAADLEAGAAAALPPSATGVPVRALAPMDEDGGLPSLGVVQLPDTTAGARAMVSDGGLLVFMRQSPDGSRSPFTAPPAAPPDSASSISAVQPSDAGAVGPMADERATEARSAENRFDPARDRAARVLCGSNACPPGQVCCNSSCGICTPPGGTCSQQICGTETLPLSAPCGPNTCNVGQVCCNPSCGICAAPGATCSQTPCESPKLPYSVSCGLNTCNVGEVCCNPSCGICAPPGQTCRTEPCL
jgi:hypothetical protein